MVKNQNNNFIYLTLIIMIVFLLTDNLTYLVASYVLIIFVYLIIYKKFKLKLSVSIILLSTFILLSCIHIIFPTFELTNVNSNIKEVFRFSFYILLALVMFNIRVSKSVFKISWMIIFYCVLTIAIFQYFKWFDINNILASIYGESIHLVVSDKYTTLDLFRAGSIFINPNGYAKFILLFLTMYLYLFKIKLSNIFHIFLLASIILSLILAGSRTGIIIAIILVLIKVINIGKITFNKRTLVFSYAILLIVPLTFYFNSDILRVNLDFFRLFDINQGIEISLGYKYETFKNILNFFNVYNHLLGLGAFPTTIVSLTLIDFDFGYLYAYYGFIGVLTYILLLTSFYKISLKETNKKFSLSLILIIILFGFTGGFLFNLQFFSIIILIMIVNLTKEEKI